MRTTVEFDEDAAQALARLRRETGMGVSEAVNHLVRRGLAAESASEPFVQKTHPLGIRIDVSNVAEAIDLLEGPQSR
ncbi:CopG family transcriptional regulator [Candidatus Poriferisodalis sp.]|uniref:CopG family transcriptional regulator n=1 Tax=Candidatus Poriferisodalis sp. TaxID=3101277 RepID=UPI003B5A2451